MAYGFVEISGVTAAITAIDTMCKTADVTLVTWEKRWGGRLVTVIIQGEVSAVNEAVAAVKTPVACGVLPSPHSEITRIIHKSKNLAPTSFRV